MFPPKNPLTPFPIFVIKVEAESTKSVTAPTGFKIKAKTPAPIVFPNPSNINEHRPYVFMNLFFLFF